MRLPAKLSALFPPLAMPLTFIYIRSFVNLPIFLVYLFGSWLIFLSINTRVALNHQKCQQILDKIQQDPGDTERELQPTISSKWLMHVQNESIIQVCYTCQLKFAMWRCVFFRRQWIQINLHSNLGQYWNFHTSFSLKRIFLTKMTSYYKQQYSEGGTKVLLMQQDHLIHYCILKR